VAIANHDETQMNFEGFVRVHNNSGEEYEDAQVRLVVGTINLVEKIAQLAQIPMSEVSKLADMDRLQLRDEAMKTVSGRGGAGGRGQVNEKEIIKEGLSEYFIYTIEGTETIANGWSKRMRSLQASTVPFKIQYRYRPQEYGDQLVRMYLLTNNAESKLGTSPLPDGMVRTFRDNGRDGLSFLVAQSIKYVPVGDKIELNLGVDPQVVFELIKLRLFRDNIWLRLNGAGVYRRADDGAVNVATDSSVAGWDSHEIFTQRVRNYTTKPIDLEIRRAFSGHVVYRSDINPTLHDFQTVQMTSSIEPGKKIDLIYEVVDHQGYNAKQNNVTLEKAQVSP
jgi:hypothetical protein